MSLRVRPSSAPMYRRISELAPLGFILLAAAAIRTWQLSSNGFGREYYAAGVRSMMSCLHCFFFNSFDPGGFVSLDKPPIAIWLQVLAAKIIGFSGTAMLLPQVIEGLLAIVLTYVLVERAFGRIAGIISAGLLAVTPVAVAVDRSNNMESCLVVVLLCATWAALHAAETGGIWSLILAMALLGLGFNVEMGAALALAPVLLGLFVSMSGGTFARCIAYSAVAALVLVVVSLSWIAIYDFTPASARPYAGGTSSNSMLELAVLHNGADRFIARPRANGPVQAAVAAAIIAPAVDARARRSLINNTPVGLLRLFRPRQAGQAAWWLPVALAGVVLGWDAARRPERRRGQRIMIAAWSGWIALYWLVFSFAGGVVHYYYLAVLAPPLAALAGIGVSTIVHGEASDAIPRWALPALLSITAAWQGYLVMGEVGVSALSWVTGAWAASAALVLLVSTMLVLRHVAAGRQEGVSTMILGGFAALCVMPIACALSVVLVKPNPSIPIVDLAAYQDQDDGRSWRRGLRNTAATDKLLAYLQAQRGSERYLVAVPSSLTAAPLIIATGKPVIAMGGFAGSDPILTPQQLQKLIDTGQVRFVMVGDPRSSRRRNANLEAIGDWVRAHGKPVEPQLWRVDREPARESARARQAVPPELFDFRG